MPHQSFFWDLIGKLGAPIFAATLVACLLQMQYNTVHLVLLALSFAMLVASHWRSQHHTLTKPN